MQLDADKKWETDAVLRQAMSQLRQAMTAALPAIHGHRLSAQDYGELAKKVEAEVGNIVGGCKLPAAADQQLHVVVGALNQYAKYFDDPGFASIAH